MGGEAAETPFARRGVLAVAATLLAVELIPNALGFYGLFGDEYYYVACSEHLSAGYVDHPPGVAWILAVARLLMGDSLFAIRVLPALAGAATVVLTAAMAWRMGAGPRGQILAGTCIAVAPIPVLMFGFYSMNAFEILGWAGACYVLVQQANTGDDRHWRRLGVIAGLALLTKHTFVLFAAGLAVGFILTPHRAQLRRAAPWVAVGIASLVFLPNLVWQVQHDFITLDFYRGAEAKNVKTPSLEVLIGQLLYFNPLGAVVWIAGAAFLLRSPEGARWRHLGIAFVTLLALTVITQRSRPDRIAGIYPVVFAAGAVWWERWSLRKGKPWIPAAVATACAVLFVPFSPVVLPVLPPERLGPYSAALGVVPTIEAGNEELMLPQWMEDRLGWEIFVDDVVAVAEAMDPAELDPEKARILAPSYSHAGALELAGKDRRLPPVAGIHNTYALWSQTTDPVEVVIILGFSGNPLAEYFESTETVHTMQRDAVRRQDVDIVIGRGLRVPFNELIARLRRLG